MSRYPKGSGIAPRDADGKQHHQKKPRIAYGIQLKSNLRRAIKKKMAEFGGSQYHMKVLEAGLTRVEEIDMGDFKSLDEEKNPHRVLITITQVLHKMHDAQMEAEGLQPIRIGMLPERDGRLQKHLRPLFHWLFPGRVLPNWYY